jgi:hypothetical protein
MATMPEALNVPEFTFETPLNVNDPAIFELNVKTRISGMLVGAPDIAVVVKVILQALPLLDSNGVL